MLDHPLVRRAQAIPEQREVNAAERIVSLTDRAWYKVKTGNQRGACGIVEADDPLVDGSGQRWWLVAAGTRQDDSPQRDFYARLTDEAHRGGRNTCSTTHLLPTEWDFRRLRAEMAVNAQAVLHETTRRAIARALQTGEVVRFVVGERDVRVRVRVLDDGEAYLAVGTLGTIDPTFMLAILASVPTVSHEHWQPEPGGAIDLAPERGEILWSTLLPLEAQHSLLEETIEQDR